MLERIQATRGLEESPVHRRAPRQHLRVQHLAQEHFGRHLPLLPQQLPTIILGLNQEGATSDAN